MFIEIVLIWSISFQKITLAEAIPLKHRGSTHHTPHHTSNHYHIHHNSATSHHPPLSTPTTLANFHSLPWIPVRWPHLLPVVAAQPATTCRHNSVTTTATTPHHNRRATRHRGSLRSTQLGVQSATPPSVPNRITLLHPLSPPPNPSHPVGLLSFRLCHPSHLVRLIPSSSVSSCLFVCLFVCLTMNLKCLNQYNKFWCIHDFNANLK